MAADRPVLRSFSGEENADCETATATVLADVAEALGRLRYAAIQLVVHDGRLVQIEVTERKRFA